MISVTAPGKVVLWGEYAVLAGAPAVVMAVNRQAHCTIDKLSEITKISREIDKAWTITPKGFAAEPVTQTLASLMANKPVPTDSTFLLWHILQQIGIDGLPESAHLVMDTSAFFRKQKKLGIGSSAALCVAVYRALAGIRSHSVNGHRPLLEQVLVAHRSAQGDRGSGLDVAAAWHGGIIEFQLGEATPPRIVPAYPLPDGLKYRFFWTAQPSSTPEHLARFETYRKHSDSRPLAALCEASQACTQSPSLITLGQYVRALENFDAKANLGIYQGRHKALKELATADDVVYKPCGAGGGDLGVVFYLQPDAAEHFTDRARALGAQPIALDISNHGSKTSR